MNPWRPYPLLRPGIALLAGMASAICTLPVPLIPSGILAILPVCFFLQALFPGTLNSFRTRWINGILLHIALFLLGSQLPDARISGRHCPPNEESSHGQIYLAVICDPPTATLKTSRLIVTLFRISSNSGLAIIEGKCLIYLNRSLVTGCLAAGNQLLINGKPDCIPGPLNPDGFDARKYYSGKGIFHRMYVPTGSWKILSMKPSFSLPVIACNVRDRLLGILAGNGLQGQEFAVGSALLLGYVNDIDRELLQDYSATGAMHILSVSGMHAGIVFLFLEFLLGFMNKRRNLVLVKSAIIILSIFAYALITGLSPPVLRAAVMLNLLVAGKTMKRHPDLLNVVAASLILLLAVNPALLSDTGFQFSYLAVLGIVLLYKPIYDLYVTSAWLPDKIWSLLAVSLAAQLATFPLGLYCFHQFPNYFLLTNLLVVPLSSLIIYFGIFSLAVGQVPVVCSLSGEALSFLIKLLNGCIRLIEGLPFSATRGVFISLPFLLMSYVLIGIFFLFILQKKKRYLFMFLGLLVILQASIACHRFKRLNHGEFVVYQAGNHTAVDFISREANFLLVDSPPNSGEGYLRQELVTHWSATGTTTHSSGYLVPGENHIAPVRMSRMGFIRTGEFVRFSKRSVCFLSRSLPPGIGMRLRVDFLVVYGEYKQDLSRILEWYRPGTIILTGRVPLWERRKLTEAARRNHVSVYDVRVSGAFIRVL